MAKIIKNIYLLFILILSSFVLFSCGDLPEEEARTLESISVSPSSASLAVGETQRFTADALYSDGSSSLVYPSWSVNGAIGTISATGLFTATAEGTGSIHASYSGKSALAAVTVTGQAVDVLAAIEITPSTLISRAGESYTFTAAGTNATGESVEIAPAWSISGDSIGTLTSDGTIATLEANAEGIATISCASLEVVGYAYVTIEGYVVEIEVETDTYVDETNPSDSFGSDTSIKAGYVSSTDRHYECYLRFPLGLIPDGATIDSATLRAYATSAGSSALQLKVLSGTFTNSTSWNTRPAIGSFIASGVFTAGDYNNVSDDKLTEIVQNWKSAPSSYPNYGLAILQEGSVDGTVVILSLENGSNYPLLRIEYSLAD